jgi:hypothetical protein
VSISQVQGGLLGPALALATQDQVPYIGDDDVLEAV